MCIRAQGKQTVCRLRATRGAYCAQPLGSPILALGATPDPQEGHHGPEPNCPRGSGRRKRRRIKRQALHFFTRPPPPAAPTSTDHPIHPHPPHPTPSPTEREDDRETERQIVRAGHHWSRLGCQWCPRGQDAIPAGSIINCVLDDASTDEPNEARTPFQSRQRPIDEA